MKFYIPLLSTSYSLLKTTFCLSTLLLLLSTSSFAQDTLFFETFDGNCDYEEERFGFFDQVWCFESPTHFSETTGCENGELEYKLSTNTQDVIMTVFLDSLVYASSNEFIEVEFDFNLKTSTGKLVLYQVMYNNLLYKSGGDCYRVFNFLSNDTELSDSGHFLLSLPTQNDNIGILTLSFFLEEDDSAFLFLDNFLITKQIVNSVGDRFSYKEDKKLLFYLDLQGRKIRTPQQGQFLIMVFDNGEKEKKIYLTK